jgi:pilus assembly protein Flp/PilA
MSRQQIGRRTRHLLEQLARLLRRAPALGQSMVEYAIIAALIAIIALAAVRTLGSNVSGVFTNIGNSVSQVESDTSGAGGGGTGH